MAYDAFGNYTGPDIEAVDPMSYETEEERRKRLAAEAKAKGTEVTAKQEVTTYADGSQTRTIQQEVPAQPVAPVAAPQAAQVQAPVAPSAYNTSIAQQESGNNPNIGYHNPQAGSAYGTYGITAPGYQDARKLNPALPQDITQATPAQQTQAMDAYTQQNAKYLTNYGVEPTQQNLAAAHFLGAKGLSDYLRDGTISPAAAQANGGEEKVRAIVNARLGGQPAAASGAVAAAPTAAPAAATPESMFEAAGKDPFAWMKLAQDKTLPPATQMAAKQHAHELLTQEFNMGKAKEQATAAITAAASGDPKASRAIADELKNQEGSWVKMILLGFLSPQLAGEEAVKLGFGNKWVSATDDKGNTGLIQVNAKGMPLKGITADNKTMSQEEVARFGAGGVGALKAAELPSVHGTPVVNAAGEGGMRMYDPRTRQAYVQVGKERRPDQGWTTTGQAPGATFNAAAAKAQGTAAGEGLTPTPVPAMPGVANTGTPGMMPAQPGAAVGPGAVAGPAVPGTPAVTGAVPVPQGGAPVTAPVAPGVAVAGRPAATISQQRLGIEAQKDQQQAYTKYVAEDIQPKADAGAQISRIRKDQVAGPDGILNNPELAGLMQGTGGKGAEVANIVRDLITGNFKDQADLSSRVAALDLTPRQKDVLYKQIGLNTQIAPLTLKANAGAGSVSDSEQKANREANVDITRQPLYSGLTLMTRDQFEKDLQVARNDFRSARPDIATTDQLNRAWSDEKRKAQAAYDQIYSARAAYIAKYNPDGKNAGAVVDAFKHYPVPEWTGQSWDYKTDYARKAARPGLSSFNK
jgi:hypothetical protein